MRKLAFCIGKNKDADQLCSNCAADQRLCLRYTDSSQQFLFFLNLKFKLLTIFCGCTARFVWDLVGNPEDWFSHNEAQIINDVLLSIHNLCFEGEKRA